MRELVGQRRGGADKLPALLPSNVEDIENHPDFAAMLHRMTCAQGARMSMSVSNRSIKQLVSASVISTHLEGHAPTYDSGQNARLHSCCRWWYHPLKAKILAAEVTDSTL